MTACWGEDMNRSLRDALFSLGGATALIGLLVVLIGGDSNESAAPATTPESAATVLPPTVVAATAPGATVVPVESTTTSTTTTSTTTTTIVLAGPRIEFLQSTDSELWEESSVGDCATRPSTAVVTATIADPDGVLAAVFGWGLDFPGATVEWIEMFETDPGVYTAEVGPFDSDTLEPGLVESIYLAIEAVDDLDNAELAETADLVLLHDCGAG